MVSSITNSQTGDHHHQVTVISETTVFPSEKSTMADLKLSVSDLPMLSCNYIQKGSLFLTPDSNSIIDLPSHLKSGLSKTLTKFPPLAGRLFTDEISGEIFITCNDAGAGFIHSSAPSVYVRDILSDKFPEVVNGFFATDGEVSYAGHRLPILTVQVTFLADGVFIGCSVNHAVTDGTSFWNFFNTFADLCKGVDFEMMKSKSPDFSRDSVLVSNTAILRIPAGGPVVTFAADEPMRERIFSFSRWALLSLKAKANGYPDVDGSFAEIVSKQGNDVVKPVVNTTEISSFMSLCALLWKCVTRARKLGPTKTTTFRMAVNCRHRINPKLDPLYFGNAIQSVPTTATAGEVVKNELRWSAELLRQSVAAHDDKMIRKYVGEWEKDPKCFPLGNFDGAMLTMGSSPRFPMYENDFGWGKPVAVRSGRANKFDGKMSAFPGRRGGGSVDVEVVLCPQTMAALEADPEFLEYVS